MTPDVTVHLPPVVRRSLRDALETGEQLPIPVALRVVTLTVEDAETVEHWLIVLCESPDAPRDCRRALELLRDARRLRS
jgi:hypothetical protein